MSYLGKDDLAAQIGEFRRFVHGMIRRMKVLATDGPLWRVLGHNGGSGGDETIDLAPYTGIGIYARPPADGGQPEVLMVALGGAKAVVAVGARDEATRREMAALQPDETAIFTSKAIVVIKADGTVEIRSKEGTASPVTPIATTAQIMTALTNAIATLGGATVGGITLTALKNALLTLDLAWPTGTTVLNAE